VKGARWERVKEVLDGALMRPVHERAAFLDEACGDDAELRAEVEQLLGAAGRAEGGFLLPPPAESPATGASIGPGSRLGEFELLSEIGRGGMGVVFQARQAGLGRFVALKVLPIGLTTSQRQIDRFVREARSVARLTHPNIVSVLTVGEAPNFRYFVMEYVEGGNLAEEITRLRENLGAGRADHAHLPSSRASDYFRCVAEVMLQAADGLAHAHEHGVIHRDIKPANLLLDGARRVKIVDFGLARDEELGSLSTTGDVIGTPHYMSPEQARAQRHAIDHRTDIYSLGVVLFELLTLKRPFEGKTSQEVIANLLERAPPRIRAINPRVPRDLETICNTAMARELTERYASAGALGADLARFLAHEAIHARPPGPLRRARDLLLRHRFLLLAAVVVLVTSTLGSLAVGWRARHQRRAELLRRAEQAQAAGPLESIPPAQLLELRVILRELGAEGGVVAAESSDAVRALEREFARLHSELRARGEADLAFARDEQQPEGVREMHRLAGFATLLHAAHVFPEDEELRTLSALENAYPTLSVRATDEAGRELPAEVWLREVDVRTSAVGPKRRLGMAPLLRMPVRSGYYRVVVEFVFGGFRELICNPSPAFMTLELVARRNTNEAAMVDEMVLVAGTRFTFPEFESVQRLFQGKSADVGAFYLDATEVSNVQYDRFLAATGRAAPRLWSLAGDRAEFLRAYGDRPATGVTWKDAVAYAEWAGKRLPTAIEWNLAAGGEAGWAQPHASARDAPAAGNVFAPLVAGSIEEMWASYLRYSANVISYSEACTPSGLYHMYGNVAEWSESMALVLADESHFVPHPFERLFFGHAWDAHTKRVGMRDHGFWGMGPDFGLEYLGFRCAKSAEP
jgi:serine/threonine protein kinase/formylglycine-generating enzyme required for sulfatase activity